MRAALNSKTLLGLGLLLGVGSGKPPGEWLSSAHSLLRKRQSQAPLESTATVVLASAVAFFVAERGKNAQVKTWADALSFVTSKFGAAPSSVTAVTETGKLLASALVTYGPALAARAFDRPEDNRKRDADGERLAEMTALLENILRTLREERRSA
jgi:voltage-gated potassium channel